MPVKRLKNAIQAAYFAVKPKDIFNLKEFYKAMREWLNEYGWSSVDANGKLEGKDHWETLYLERINLENDSEQWWWWRLQKIPSDNSYYKYHLDIDSHPLYILNTEVMRNGKKFKCQKGEVEVKVWAYIEFDYTGEWSRHPILRLFNKMFPRRIFKREMYEDHKMELYREVSIFQAYIKRWFKLKSFLPFEEITPFFTPFVYPEWKKE